MKTGLKFIGVIAFLSSSLNAAELPCEKLYTAALDHLSSGDYPHAVTGFQQAIRLSPTPSLEEPEYLPYIHLAVASFKAEQFRIARQALIQSQIYGLAARSQVGKQLINTFAANIMTASARATKVPLQDVAQTGADISRQLAFTLSDERVELIRSAVLRRCAVSADVDKNKLPWYFHYEFGVDLMEAGDAQRALDSFILGANIREQSKRRKRMYGMWFINYLPYYQIALAHSRLGEWKSARDAILTSESFGEFSPADPDYEAYSALNRLIRNNLKKNGS